MFPNDPRVIHGLSDLKEVANQMKIAAWPDDQPDGYTKTKEEADRLKRLEGLSPEQLQEIRTSGASRAIFIAGQFVSLVMSTDEQHGHQWHLSMVRITGPQEMAPVGDETGRLILDIFFSKWESIENPGQLVEVMHFVGDD